MDSQKFIRNFNPINLGCSGIVNLGNTCFMNSSIQCLSATLPLTRYFLTGKCVEDMNPSKNEFILCQEYIRTLIGMWEDNCIVSPISLKTKIANFHDSYVGFRQNDSHEFFVRLIELLHIGFSYKVDITYTGKPVKEYDLMKIEALKVWKQYFKNQYSIIISLFYGQFNSTMTCNLCNHVYHSYDPFCTISLPINDETKTIYDCFDVFSKKEVLDVENKWKCDKCSQYSQAAKKIIIWNAPKILIINFKRFDHLNRKNEAFIDYPVKGLNINKYVSNSTNAIYNLYAVSAHIGTVTRGHYIAYSQNANGTWYNYSDRDVEPINESDIVNKHAYMLLYRRLDVDFD